MSENASLPIPWQGTSVGMGIGVKRIESDSMDAVACSSSIVGVDLTREALIESCVGGMMLPGRGAQATQTAQAGSA